jgi:hypothetical protein
MTWSVLLSSTSLSAQSQKQCVALWCGAPRQSQSPMPRQLTQLPRAVNPIPLSLPGHVDRAGARNVASKEMGLKPWWFALFLKLFAKLHQTMHGRFHIRAPALHPPCMVIGLGWHQVPVILGLAQGWEPAGSLGKHFCSLITCLFFSRNFQCSNKHSLTENLVKF